MPRHCLHGHGEYDDAEKSLKTVSEMFPNLLLPHLWLAQMYYKIGRKELASSELELIRKAKPKVMSEAVKAIKQDAERLLQLL